MLSMSLCRALHGARWQRFASDSENGQIAIGARFAWSLDGSHVDASNRPRGSKPVTLRVTPFGGNALFQGPF
jgi:hypothetical protein